MIDRSPTSLKSINSSICSDDAWPTLLFVGCSRNLQAGVGSVTFTFFRACSFLVISQLMY